MPKNLTISADEKVLYWARQEAARRNTSVSKFVGQLLEEQMRRTDAYWKAFEDWKKIKPVKMSGKVGDFTREQLYERGS